jgi:hypothetical protein
MLIEAVQAAAEAAKQGSVTIAIPTAFLSSAATLLLYKGVPFVINAMRGKPRHANGNGGPKPGMASDCLKHRDKLTEHETKLDGLDVTLKRYEGYFQDILQRLPK